MEKHAERRSASHLGLCLACERQGTCTYPRDPGRPVLQCLEFEELSVAELEGDFALAVPDHEARVMTFHDDVVRGSLDDVEAQHLRRRRSGHGGRHRADTHEPENGCKEDDRDAGSSGHHDSRVSWNERAASAVVCPVAPARLT